MDIADSHKENKKASYWDDLTGGTTSQYKEKVMEALIREHYSISGGKLLDVGCGTCETILKYSGIFGARSLTCLDYDPKVLEKMKLKLPGGGIIWKVADVFEIGGWAERFDLVFFMDMLHEIYSFYGRRGGNVQSAVDHTSGKEHVVTAVTNISRLVNRGGGIIITDDVLCPEDVPLRVLIRNRAAREAAEHFLSDYPSRRIAHSFQPDGVLSINSRDFCVLLTQYNKIKRKDMDRWNVERFEVHQYMTPGEYEDLFNRLGFYPHAIVGTPAAAMREWEEDFTVLEGLPGLPQKRITLLAVRR